MRHHWANTVDDVITSQYDDDRSNQSAAGRWLAQPPKSRNNNKKETIENVSTSVNTDPTQNAVAVEGGDGLGGAAGRPSQWRARERGARRLVRDGRPLAAP